ncbi:MAG: T9SS type A sorting domain-containing protein [Bacteroidetes bacterium]|nr:T9SS type A sorting domain-containing protein [Bacteroidota bacterium]
MKKIYFTFQLTLLTFLIKAQFCSPVVQSNITVSSNTACAGSVITCNATGGSLPAGAYYNWRANYSSGSACSSSSGIDFGQQGSPVNVVTGSQFVMPATGQATYYIRLTAVCSNGVRTCASTEIAVSRVGAPVITTQNTQVVYCPGTPASIAVTVANGGTYTWTKNGTPFAGATTPTINFAAPTATNEGVYRCIATNACGTTTSSAITFTTLGNQNVTGAATTLTNTTLGYQVTNLSTQGVSYNWSLPSGGTITSGATTNSVSVNWGNTVGIYTISVQKTLGACQITDTKTVSVELCGNNPLLPGTTTPTICGGESANLFLSGIGFYTWSTGQQNTGISVTPSATTVYSVQANDAFGCPQTGTVQVAVLPLPTFTASATSSSICAGESSTLSINAINFTDYVWYTPFTPNTNLVVTPTVTSTYGFQVFNTNQCGVSGSFTVTVNTCAGISELEALNSITLQPNPTSTFFTLSNVAEGTTVNVMDVTGKVAVYKSVIDADKTMTIETDNLSNGIYVIQLNNNGAVAHKKLIISK